MNVSELEGAELDAAVATAEGEAIDRISDDTVFVRIADTGGIAGYAPSRDWLRAGPIIERERIELQNHAASDGWWAGIRQHAGVNKAGGTIATGPTPLIAAMRAYVASKVS